MTRGVSVKKCGGAVFKICLIAVLVGLVIVPLLNMLTVLTAEDIRAVLTGARFLPAFGNTLWLTAAATAIVILLAYLLAWCTVRTDIRFKGLFNIILVLPMLIPSISHGMGLVILLGQNGLITRSFDLDISIYGPVGIIFGSVMYAFPVAFIMLSDVLRYEDRSVYQAADVLGIGKGRRFLHITLPYMRKPLLAAAFATFALIATDYGVPLMIGGRTKTLSLLMYEEVIGRLKFGRGCVYGLILLIPAVAAFICDLADRGRASTAFTRVQEGRKSSRTQNAFAYSVCSAVSLAALLPIIAFVLLAFAKNYPMDMTFTLDNIISTMSRRGGMDFLINSLIIAAATALAATLIGFAAAYLTARMKGGLSSALHLLVLTLMAIPGIVLGLSYVIFFSGSMVEGTLVILVMVNTAHFISSPYLMMYNTLGKMNVELEAVGRTLGVGRLRIIKDVFLPQVFGTVAEMFSYLFVNCMMTISAVSFLSTLGTRPISLMINQFEAQMQYESAAVVSLVILLVNIAVKTVIGIIKRMHTKGIFERKLLYK